MARWRQAFELAMSAEEIESLTTLSRSRSEPARRVQRARMLLAYRETPSFYAVGRSLGVHHQTVERCVERALAYGPLAALDDRPHPGKEPTITPEAKAWLVSLACDKAKEHGYPHELWTTRLLAHHAREHGPAAGHECLAKLVQGTVCKILGQEEIKPHKVRYYLEQRDAEFEQKMAEVLCVYREVQVLKKIAASRGNRTSRWRSSPTTKSRVSRPSQRRRRTCRPCPASTRPSRAIMSTNAMARSACWPGSICSPARSTPLSEIATAAASSSNSSSFSTPPIRPHCDQVDPRQSFRTHLERNQSLARRPTGRSLRVHLHAQARLLAQPHRGLLLQVRPLGPAPHPRDLKTRTQATHHGRHRRHQPSSRHPHLVLQTRRGRLI